MIKGLLLVGLVALSMAYVKEDFECLNSAADLVWAARRVAVTIARGESK